MCFVICFVCVCALMAPAVIPRPRHTCTTLSAFVLNIVLARAEGAYKITVRLVWTILLLVRFLLAAALLRLQAHALHRHRRARSTTKIQRRVFAANGTCAKMSGKVVADCRLLPKDENAFSALRKLILAFMSPTAAPVMCVPRVRRRVLHRLPAARMPKLSVPMRHLCLERLLLLCPILLFRAQ